MKKETQSKIQNILPADLSLHHYQLLAQKTDFKKTQDIGFILLGLFGETGSLLSELKKKQRDLDSYIGYGPSVIEEFGDVLWYFSTLASRLNFGLPNIAKIAGFVGTPPPSHYLRFHDLQPKFKSFRANLKPKQKLEPTFIHLGSKVGLLLDSFMKGEFNPPRESLEQRLASIFKNLVLSANDGGVFLGLSAQENLKKIFDRWPLKKEYPPLFDESFDEEERLPRRIKMEIFEKSVRGTTYVFQRCNGINIGDRITDNKSQEDDYRFHDVFHLAYAAVLGWSPVIRALFKVKRKSNPKVDETEDGARAIIIEEGVSTWIFNYAARLKFFENINSLNYDLLKDIAKLVKGYEVEICPLWQWEEAILKGYEVFRNFRKKRKGIVIADLKRRTITFEDYGI